MARFILFDGCVIRHTPPPVFAPKRSRFRTRPHNAPTAPSAYSQIPTKPLETLLNSSKTRSNVGKLARHGTIAPKPHTQCRTKFVLHFGCAGASSCFRRVFRAFVDCALATDVSSSSCGRMTSDSTPHGGAGTGAGCGKAGVPAKAVSTASAERTGGTAAPEDGAAVSGGDADAGKSGDVRRDNGFIGKAIGALLLGPVYTIFTYTVLLQSTVTRKAVNPAQWETEVKGPYWLAGLGMFLYLLALCVSGFLVDVDTPSFWAVVVLFIVSLFALHLVVLDYASMRPELCRIKPQEGTGDGAAAPTTTAATTTTTTVVVKEAFAAKPAPGTASGGRRKRCCGRCGAWFAANWRGGLAAASLGVEMAQFLAVAFLDGDVWADPNNTGLFRSVIRSILSIANNTVVYRFIIAFAAAYLLIVGVFVAWEWTATHPIAPLLFEFITGAMYLTISSRIFVVIHQTEASSRVGGCLLAALAYGSTAVFVSVYRGDEGAAGATVKYVPRFLVFERLLKGYLALSISFSRNVRAVVAGSFATTGGLADFHARVACNLPPPQFWVFTPVTLAVILLLASGLYFKQPCSSLLVIRLRLYLLACAAWVHISGIGVKVGLYDGPPVAALCAGIAVISVACGLRMAALMRQHGSAEVLKAKPRRASLWLFENPLGNAPGSLQSQRSRTALILDQAQHSRPSVELKQLPKRAAPAP